jgi:hypothetical protein
VTKPPFLGRRLLNWLNHQAPRLHTVYFLTYDPVDVAFMRLWLDPMNVRLREQRKAQQKHTTHD